MLLTLWGWSGQAAEEGSLHARVDQSLTAATVGAQTPIASDSEFLRRAWLALAGQVPSATDARAFLADQAPDKRVRLLDRLLGSSEFVHHLAVSLDVMLMERRAEKHVKAGPWLAFLEESIAANKPWDQLVRDIVSVDGADEKTRPLARWVLEREGETHLLTRDIGRLFLGRDMACAQCHDHPRIDDYSQRDYYGLQAFVGRTFLFQPDMNKPGVLGEKADGETTWTSVFTKVSGSTRPHLPGEAEIDEPELPPSEMWVVPPNDKDKNVRPVPKYSRRARLAECLTRSQTPAFRRNIANRMWAMMMGRGLVDPPDLSHSLNPPSHPELLVLLGDGMAEMKFDLKAFLRELALTRAFQQRFEPPELSPEATGLLAAKLSEWETEAQRMDSLVKNHDGEFSRTRADLENVQRATQPSIADWKKAFSTAGETMKSADAATAAWKQAEAALSAKRDVLRALADASQSTSAACKAMPQDMELVAVVKTFQTKSEKTTAEVTAAEKELAAKKAELETKAKALAEAQMAAAAKKPAADEAAKSLSVVLQRFSAVDAQKQTSRISALDASGRLSEAKALLGLAAEEAAAMAAQAAADQAQKASLGAEQELANLAAEIASRGRDMSALEKAVTDAGADATQSKQAGDTKREAVRILSEAEAKVSAAAAKLPQEADVQNAATLVKNRSEQAASELLELEKTLAVKTMAAEKAVARLGEARAAVARAQSQAAAAREKQPSLKSQAGVALAKAAEARNQAAVAHEKFVTLRSDSFAVARLIPLTPEQFCWSAMKATGFLDQQRAAATAEWDQKNPQSEPDKADPAKKSARLAAIEKLMWEKVKGHEDQFVRLFGHSAGQPQSDFFATADQALYFENAGSLRSWCSPGGENLASRLSKLADPRAIADELYLSVLTRVPTDAEGAEVSQIIASRPPDQKSAAVSDLIWAVLTSVEFRFRH